MHTPPRTYHGAKPPGDLEGSTSDASEPAAWESIASAMVGTVIDGRYRIDALLGAGAMAFVLDGHHVHLGKRVAIKVLHPELAELAELRARFQREARAASRVAHPAVIEVTDFGVSEDGLYYLVMEHLSGADLHRWASARGPLAPDVVAWIGRQLAGALDAIHRAGFVHRDVKPENIFVLDGEGPMPAIKVLDLGIAAVSAQRPDKDDPRLTRAGQTLGTVSFMAPEQVAARPLDGRVDIYATGCVLFELVTGRLPFDAETATETMMAHLREAPPDVRALRPEVPGWLAGVIAKCLAKRPEDRFADALEMGRALEVGQDTAAPDSRARLDPAEPRPVEAGSVGSRSSELAPPVAPRTRARWLAVLLGAGLVVVVASVLELVGSGSQPAQPAISGAAPVPVPTSVVSGPPGSTAGSGPAEPTSVVPRDDDARMALSDGSGEEPVGPATAGPDTVGPDTSDTSTGDASSPADGAVGTRPGGQDGDALVKGQATKPETRPRTAPRGTPRAETGPPPSSTSDPRTPSGLWRPRPPSGGDD